MGRQAIQAERGACDSRLNVFPFFLALASLIGKSMTFLQLENMTTRVRRAFAQIAYSDSEEKAAWQD